MNTSALRINERRIYPLLLAAWLLLALPLPAVAEEVAGRVVSSMGEVTAVRPDESTRSLGRGEAVYVEDTLRTGQRGRAQIRLLDDGLLDLRPLSRLTIDAYDEPADDEDDEGGSAVMSFLRGAMRTVSGRIGRDPEDEYRMNTPTATVGIRGTDYSLQYCDAACADPSVGRPEGLYGRVDEGTVDVTNAAGTGAFSDGDYFYVADDDTLPEQLIGPPPGILDGSDDGQAPEDDEDDPDIENPEAALTRDDDDPELEDPMGGDEFTSGDDNPEPSAFRVTRAAAGGVFLPTSSQTSGGIARVGDGSAADFVVDNDNEVVAIDFADGRSVEVNGAQSNPGAGASLDTAEVFWGRWRDSDGEDLIRFVDADGSEAFARDFIYMYSEDVTTPEQLAGLSGDVFYGGPSGPSLLPFNFSSTWTVDNFTLAVDFTALTADVDIDLTGGSCNELSIDIANNGIDIDSLEALGFDLSGTWDNSFSSDGGAVVGSLEGQFVGVTAEGVIVSFELERLDGSNQTIEEIIGTQLLEELNPV